MKKILSFFAFVAIVLTFAACGGNEPEIKNFQFLVKTLSTKEYIKITASNPKAYLYAHREYYDGQTVDDFRKYTEDFLLDMPFLENEDIYQGYVIFSNSNQSPDTEYVVWACLVEEDPETQKTRIVGNIEYVIYKTMPENTLNGEFTVDANGKKVHFAEGNKVVDSEGIEYVFTSQTGCWGDKNGDPADLLTWSWTTAEKDATPSKPFFTLSRNEWIYLFRARDRAEELFAHATVNGTKGLILLPDNWQTPDGISLTTTSQMKGFAWDENESKYSISEDGFEKNKLPSGLWEELEFAGAVFLPAAGSGKDDIYKMGWYWTSSPSDSDPAAFAYMFRFEKNNVDLSFMTKYSVKQTLYNFSIRDVRILK